jgi:hypothetical protein
LKFGRSNHESAAGGIGFNSQFALHKFHAAHVGLGSFSSDRPACDVRALLAALDMPPERRRIIAYNSCRNRHCPKCQGAAAREWLAEREAELLPVPYYHIVFTLPARIADIAYQNKAVIYDLLLKASSETLLTIAADPKHLGARIGILSVLHTWGSAMTHHPHVHMIVRAAGSRSTQSAGSRADRASSWRCPCSRNCSAGCSCTSSAPLIRPVSCSSWASIPGLSIRKHSLPI